MQILSDLKQARARVLQLLPDPHHSTAQLETAIQLYLSLTRGFLEAKTSDEDKMQASKLRHAIRCVQRPYVWNNIDIGGCLFAMKNCVKSSEGLKEYVNFSTFLGLS